MRYVVCAVAILYAVMSIYAAGVQLRNPKRKKPALVMLVGGLILLLAWVLEMAAWNSAWLVTVIGTLLICQAALLIGKAEGRTKPEYYAVRFIITVFLIFGMLIW